MSIRKEQLESNKLQKRLRRNVGKAVAAYRMIEEGDRIMVCLSGGKDSYAMLDILMNLQKNAPVQFELVAVNLDQKQPGFPEQVLPNYLDTLDIEYHILEKDTYSVVTSKIPEGKTYCSLCSRLRRGTLYGFAEQIGATKVALGHHRDDIVETLFLNMFLTRCLTICLTICLTMCLTILLTICLTILLTILLTICLTMCLTILLTMCLTICLTMFLTICLIMFLTICLTMCLTICLTMFLTILLTICLTICLTIMLTIC